MRRPLLVILTIGLLRLVALNEAPDAKSTTPRTPPPAAAAPVPVVGSATIEGEAKTAILTFEYSVDGVQRRSTDPPRMRVVRITSSVPKLAVKLPDEVFAIKIGPDMQRIFEEPVLVDSEQEVVCSCRMREDCGKGGTFRCGLEGELVE